MGVAIVRHDKIPRKEPTMEQHLIQMEKRHSLYVGDLIHYKNQTSTDLTEVNFYPYLCES